MNAELPFDAATMRIDKSALQQAIAEQNQRMGFVKDPTATADKAQALLLAQGIIPEDNIASCEIIAMRYEKREQE